MRRTWTIIGVANVAHSFRWYQTLLGLSATIPAHDYFGQLLDTDGTVLLSSSCSVLGIPGGQTHIGILCTSPARLGCFLTIQQAG